jgi:hypothetical protein
VVPRILHLPKDPLAGDSKRFRDAGYMKPGTRPAR